MQPHLDFDTVGADTVVAVDGSIGSSMSTYSTMFRPHPGRWMLRITAVTVVVAATLPVATSTQIATAATPPVDAPHVSLLGDSTMAGMAWNSTTGNDPRDIVGNSYRLTFDAESCRRLVHPSCRGRFGSVPMSLLPLNACDAQRTARRGDGGDGGI